ncbi:MAG: 4Fe-4S dicluster domain-containing protein [Gemmatimonadetes bacterium]|nr:MAG: 4Fe-4S dicluster domain-containing protein [Gemmatimonadota bacterium]
MSPTRDVELPVLSPGASPASTPPAIPTSTDRRRFLSKALAAAGTATFLNALSGRAAEIPREQAAPILARTAPGVEGNIHERMLDDLHRALAKPMEQRKWVMVIDLQKCIGCKACTVSCNAENNLPPGVVYRPVVEEEIGEFPNVRRRFIPRPCMQCDNPPCTPVCPVNATYKRPDGIVAIDYDVCIGCRYCIAACPYNARTADFGEFFGDGVDSEAFVADDALAYQTRPNFEYGREWRRRPGHEDSPMGNARKCQFCLHRIENGLLPACVTTCLGGATFFGDYNDKDSLVHELVGSTRMMRLKEELGTEPSVFYLV